MSAVRLHSSGKRPSQTLKRDVTDFNFPLLIALRRSMIRALAGRHSKRHMGHGKVTKASPPSFVDLTTVWAVLGQKSFVKT